MLHNYVRTDVSLLDIKHVSMRYGNRLVLRDVCATVTDLERADQVEGQVICFLGPSGIGKTQLSRIMAGLLTPTEGSVTLKDDMPTAPGRVGMVPQNYPFFEYLTVLDNLLLAGRKGGLSLVDAKTKADSLIEKFGLQNYRRMYRKELSGGTQQRVAIARQLMCAGHYIVMDEPFSGQDPIMKRAATELIGSLAQDDTLNTIIIVTHDVTEGLSCADTAWLMGYEPNPEKEDEWLEGARLVEQHDLAAMNLCWRPDITDCPEFITFVQHIKNRFRSLR